MTRAAALEQRGGPRVLVAEPRVLGVLERPDAHAVHARLDLRRLHRGESTGGRPGRGPTAAASATASPGRGGDDLDRRAARRSTRRPRTHRMPARRPTPATATDRGPGTTPRSRPGRRDSSGGSVISDDGRAAGSEVERAVVGRSIVGQPGLGPIQKPLVGVRVDRNRVRR